MARHSLRDNHARPGAAPADLLRQDYKLLDARDMLRTTWQVEELILLQSVQGRAHEGHGAFRGTPYPNTTCDDVARALHLDTASIRSARQSLIDDIADYVECAMEGPPPSALITRELAALLGISFLRFLRVDPSDVVRGIHLGGMRDDVEVRAEVEANRGMRIGGGKAYWVDYARMRSLGMSADTLAHGEWEGQIDELREKGLIVDASRAGEPEVVYQYIRHRRGPGASDDAAIVGAGLLWGLGVAVGVFLADAVDTLEKYVTLPADQDERLAARIARRRPEMAASSEQVEQLVMLSTMPENEDLPDSSLRHLLIVDRRTDLCALEAHLLTVEGIPTPSIGLSHGRSPSHRFYDYLRKRIDGLA
jgi:hypothetical protein